MKIQTVSHAVPSLAISNAYVVEAVREANRGRLPVRELDLIERRLTHFFEAAGTNVRYRLAPGQKAIDVMLEAGRKALSGADVDPESVDLLLYAGVSRGWIEPAMASVAQHELGLVRATCFDVVDACASWLRALQIAHTYLRAGVYSRAMIVNCECAIPVYVDWKLDGARDLEHRAAEWTLGEAATATIVDASVPDDDFYFVFRNYGAHFGLCMYPLTRAGEFIPGSPDTRYAPLRFFALSSELISTVTRRLVEEFLGDPRLRERRHDIIFGHEASRRVNRMLGKQLGLAYERYVSTHGQYGNTVAASVPLGMSIAVGQGRLNRGDRVLVLVGASGVTIGLATFTF